MKRVIDDYINNKIKLDIGIISFVIVISGVFGWVYEFIFYYFNGGCKIWYMQGGNFLPWINIYAIGSLIIMFTTYNIRKSPLKVFLVAVLFTGILEYFSGLVILKLCDGLRLWDYNTEILNFGNIGGFVCLRSVLFFGISSLFLVYVIVPILIYISSKVDKKFFLIVGIVLVSIVLFDEIYNLVIARTMNLPRASDIYKSMGYEYVEFPRG